MLQSLANKKILLGITGSIATYKCLELIRLLREQGAEIRVVLSDSAKEFVTPLSLQTLSGNPVHCELFHTRENAAIEHIELARWADLILIAPASANFMARLAHGFADDLLTTLCLASDKKIVLAPAMNQQMWRNPITQNNIALLNKFNIEFWGPDEGNQACGENGPGRLINIPELLARICQQFSVKLFNGCNVVITAGPTREAIDPVRFISNHSSGKMGYAIAAAAAQQGAKVTLISGPTNLPCPLGVIRNNVINAREMHQAVMDTMTACDIFIATAAVADYRPQIEMQNKLKKLTETIALSLTQNPDIVATVANLPNPPFTVAFAAETENLVENAIKKLQQKKAAMIIANQVGNGLGFDNDYNQLIALTNKLGQIEFPLATKNFLAKELLLLIHQQWQQRKHNT